MILWGGDNEFYFERDSYGYLFGIIIDLCFKLIVYKVRLLPLLQSNGLSSYLNGGDNVYNFDLFVLICYWWCLTEVVCLIVEWCGGFILWCYFVS